MLSVFFLFLTGVGVYVGVCGCTQSHTRKTRTTRGVLGCEPRVGTRHLESPKNPDGQSRHICIRMCVQCTHMCVFAGLRDEILSQFIFFFHIAFLPKQKRKRCERNTKDSNQSSMKLV